MGNMSGALRGGITEKADKEETFGPQSFVGPRVDGLVKTWWYSVPQRT